MIHAKHRLGVTTAHWLLSKPQAAARCSILGSTYSALPPLEQWLNPPSLCLLDLLPIGYESLSVLNELLRVLEGWIIVNEHRCFVLVGESVVMFVNEFVQ